jgi:hypothetical protein
MLVIIYFMAPAMTSSMHPSRQMMQQFEARARQVQQFILYRTKQLPTESIFSTRLIGIDCGILHRTVEVVVVVPASS